MEITPDAHIFWQWGPIVINATLMYTWIVMLLLGLGSWLITRNLTSGPQPSRWQNGLESFVTLVQGQINEVVQRKGRIYLPFIGALFLFISVSNLLSIVPGFESPASSLSTTVALSLCVFTAVPVYGIWQKGLRNYLRNYIQPSPIMLPFHVIGEISRTFSLAIRLFGNMLSGNMIVAILFLIVPLLVPVLLQALGLLVGQIQAYIFAILAMVYIGSATRVEERAENNSSERPKEKA